MAFTGIDANPVYYSNSISGGVTEVVPDSQGQDSAFASQNRQLRTTTEKSFKKFLKEFNVQTQSRGTVYWYRDQIKRNYKNGRYSVEVNLTDLQNFDRKLWDIFKNEPREYLDLFEEVVTAVADEVTRPRAAEDDEIIPMQLTLSDESTALSIRQVKADKVSKLVKIPGIIVNSSTVRTKAREITLQCKTCGYVMPNVQIPAGMDGFQLPSSCPNKENQTKSENCPMDPFLILPDKSKHVDFQTMKLQEAPDSVPQGEMPRHITMFAERDLVDNVSPGMRVNVIGIFCIKRQAKAGVSARSKKVMRGQAGVGIRQAYVRVLGIEKMEESARGTAELNDLKPEEEERFRQLANQPDINKILRIFFRKKKIFWLQKFFFCYF